MPNRRGFLSTLGVAALGCATHAPGVGAFTARRPRLERIGLQLYTVRGELRRDFPGTLAEVARIGFREVEFAGYGGRPPAEVRALLAANRLTSPSTHVAYGQVTGNLDRVLADARAVGHRWVTVPSLPANERATLAGWRGIAAAFNRAGAQARAVGLRLAYHNHDVEFAPLEGTVPFDLLLAETDPELVDFQLDLYWVARAGHDPMTYLTRHPKRFVMVHVKDTTGPPDHGMVDVGAGTLDFAALLAQPGIQHHFVEHDRPTDAMASIRASYAYLSGLNG
ncbi:MAG: sugar phosphate isomerase/epimerase [Gemmatimonadota bacterium]